MKRRQGSRASAAFQVKAGLLEGVEAVKADTAFSFGRHMHDQFGIGLIDRGAQTSLSGRGMVEAGAGDVITVNPGEVHDGAPIGEGGRSWSMLYFEPWLLADLYQDMTEGKKREFVLSRPVVQDAWSAACFRALFRAMTDRDAAGRAEESLFLMLGHLDEESMGMERRSTVPGAIAAAKSRIDDEPASTVTLGELARLCGISRFQLLRSFTRATGLTPHAYVIQRRLHMARRLIRSGGDLAEAAAASGFSDQSHMTRLFVRAYGMTPGRYAAAGR